MKEREDHLFDKIIRDKMAHYAEPVPDDVWENISQKRNFISSIKIHYKLILSVLLLLVITLSVTISMTYKSKFVKQQNNAEVNKNDLNTVLAEYPVKEVAYKPAKRNNISEKPVTRIISSVNDVKIDKFTEKPSVKEENEVKATTGSNQNSDKNKTVITANKQPKTVNSTPPIIPPVEIAVIETTYKEPIISTASVQTNKEVVKPSETYMVSSDSESVLKTPEIIRINNTQVSIVVQTQSAIGDSNTLKLPENNTTPAVKTHFSFLDFIVSPGLVTKSTKSSNPASENYVSMLDRVTKTRYSLGCEIRYRYFLNSFWNVATGLMYNQVKEQMQGQIKPDQVTIKQTTGTIITPFDPPKQVTFTDTIRVPAKTISLYNTFSYLRIPILLGANFNILKIPLNVYAGFGYFYSINQQGGYISSATLEPVDFNTTMDNPYKKVQGVNIEAGINANIRITKRSYFLFGFDYSRYVIPINDSKYQFQQYYSIWNLNIGITCQLF
jgi:hypothetical protein